MEAIDDSNPDEEFVTVDKILKFCETTDVRMFGELQHLLRANVKGSNLSRKERQNISHALRILSKSDAENARALGIQESELENVLVITAYTHDYAIGKACSNNHRMYACKHGYDYRADVMSYEDMMTQIAPREFCSWYKVVMINRLLEDRESKEQKKLKWIFWVDSDAIFVNSDITVEDIAAKAGHRELIVAEDMHPSCLLNAGVLLIRVCDWSRELWRDVWQCRRYFDCYFYEQSALIRCLKRRHEGLECVQPFHSYVAGGAQDKLFPHVCVLPHLQFNSNRCGRLKVKRHDISDEDIPTSPYRGSAPSSPMEVEFARFIFHAAGRCNKRLTIHAVLRYLELPLSEADEEELQDAKSFRITRGKGLPVRVSPDEKQTSKDSVVSDYSSIGIFALVGHSHGASLDSS